MSPRAQRRLELAAHHLALSPIPSAEETLCIITGLPEGERLALKASVDWAEEYEQHQTVTD